MNANALGFKRLVLTQPSPGESAATRLAIELAQLFGAELLGLFIEDIGLSHFSAMPFAREIHALGGDWRRVEQDRFRTQFDFAAACAERAFARATGHRTPGRFQVIRGGVAELAEFSRGEDILVLRAPTAADLVTEPQASLLEAAFHSHAAVLLAPGSPVLARGAVAALAMSADDPAVEAARVIAEVAGEPLDVIEWPARGGLSHARRRLLVATRGALSKEDAIAAAARMRAPLLSLRAPRRDR